MKQNVLVISSHCYPIGEYEEHGRNWNYILDLARNHEVYVITYGMYWPKTMSWMYDEKNKEIARHIHLLWIKFKEEEEYALLWKAFNPKWKRDVLRLIHRVMQVKAKDGGITAIHYLSDYDDIDGVRKLCRKAGIDYVDGRRRSIENDRIVITSPSLDPELNVSGVSSVANFIISRNKVHRYYHFNLGRKDLERGGWHRILPTINAYCRWRKVLKNSNSLIHYSFPLSAPAIFRDSLFMWHVYKRKRRMIVHVHGGLFLNSPKIPYILNRILKWVFSWDVPFIVLSEGEKQIVTERFGAKRVFVLPNCPDFDSAVDMNETKKTHHECLVLGYLGRIEPNKGMSELLMACETLKNNGIPFKLRMAGKEQTEDEYLTSFDSLLNDSEAKRFEYVGLVYDESKRNFLESLDLFVMPTYFEGLPMSLLESMSYGIVPVVSNVGSIPDVVSDGENGLFVMPKDVDSIVEKVTLLHEDRDLLNKMSDAAKEIITSRFSPVAYIKKLNSIYKELDD